MKEMNVDKIISVLSLIIAIVSLIISMQTKTQDNVNAKTDRRVETYMDAMVSLSSLSFCEWSLENNYKIMEDNDIREQWLNEQLLNAVEIKAKLEIFDVEKAESYWRIISRIFDEQKFDTEEYQKLKQAIMNEI